MSFPEIVQVLDETQVVAVVTTRADGRPTATPIWSMVVDGVPYVRSVNGRDAWWYRHVRAGRPVAFALADGSIAERDRDAALGLPRESVATEYVPVDDEIQQRIDDELRRKYSYSPESVDAMLSEAARSCTLRVVAVD
ncbi:hypothetical protein SAMN04487783_1431 [Agrococcus baldri]|uniref:DUF2255 family protein n=1 Tax=Agrococcus baldri TaxID=153730 RepID=A0AA94KZJ1_9MICO|nr:DUF2255 family protein [Agrococcus baldri]SFS10585.1 hypothetical protein SAMN04487783_1431 [Agrococcus baldri]